MSIHCLSPSLGIDEKTPYPELPGWKLSTLVVRVQPPGTLLRGYLLRWQGLPRVKTLILLSGVLGRAGCEAVV